MDITAPEIRAELLRLESQRRERTLKCLKCIRSAYDFIAKRLLSSGVDLGDRELQVLIPGAVFEAAVEFGWVGNPHKRLERRQLAVYDPAAWVAKSYTVRRLVEVDIPDQELTESIGSIKVPQVTSRWWLGVLGGRIADWQGKALLSNSTLEAQTLATTAVTQQRRSKKPTEQERQIRSATRRQTVEPLLSSKKPEAWTPHFWAKRAGLKSPHAAYRYLNGDNISMDNRRKLENALGSPIPD